LIYSRRGLSLPVTINITMFLATMPGRKNSSVDNSNGGSEEKKLPLLSMKDREYVLTVWADARRVRLVISKRSENGWERLAVFVIPVDYMLWKLLQVEGVKDIVSRII